MPDDGSAHNRRVGRVFDAWAAAGRGESMERGHRRTAGRVLDALPVQAGEAFLDLGTGNGWAARDAAARGARAVGVDVSEAMLRRARRRSEAFARTSLGMLAHARAAFEGLPFASGAFRWAFSVEALYYARDLAAALAEARRVLAEGGELHAVVDYYAENPDSHGWPDLVGVPLHLLSESGWARACRDAGFREAGTARVRTAPGVGDAWQSTHGSLHVRARK